MELDMRKNKIFETTITNLKPHPKNPRVHTDAQIRQVCRSLKKFGFIGVVVIDDQNRILAGHARVEAARQLGWKTVPAIIASHLSEPEKLAFIIADNKLTENADWNPGTLSEVFQIMSEGELSFDLEITGFDAPEIDILLNPETADGTGNSFLDDSPIPSATEHLISKEGDLWFLGNHRLLCGDATSSQDYEALMEGDRATFVFSDPPYNVPINGHVSGKGKSRHDEFAMASGEMTEPQFHMFLERVLRLMAAHSNNGSVHDICMDWRHIETLLAASREIYSGLLNIAVWTKNNAGMGSLYRSQHELVAIFKNGTARHVNNVQLGKSGRNRSNVWAYAGANSFGSGRDEALEAHPTVKPLALVADAILDCSHRKDIVLDPFVGSGTTILAAEKTGRICYAMELAPGYVDTAIRRWQNFTGQEARLTTTGETFQEIEERRNPDAGAQPVRRVP
ncbi:MAG: site-specific DNA-methyltransferase [Alphaproteobacteria bacterium]|nr:site-specific DNA-methyltransferase [Alphaproteobacteria bacterium]